MKIRAPTMAQQPDHGKVSPAAPPVFRPSRRKPLAVAAMAFASVVAVSFAKDTGTYDVSISGRKCTNVALKSTIEVSMSMQGAWYQDKTVQRKDRSTSQKVSAVAMFDEVADGTNWISRYRVRSITKCENGVDSEVLSAGAVVEFLQSTSATIRVNGKAVDPDLAGVLRMVFNPASGGDPDKAWGTDRPRRPGETWRLDRQAILNEILRQGGHVALEDVEGSGAIGPVTNMNGKVVVPLTIRSMVKDALYPAPDQWDSLRSTFSHRMHALVPRDPSAPPNSASIATVLETVVAKNYGDGREYRIQNSTVRKEDVEILPPTPVRAKGRKP